jgi:GT2 family glycosyltransferase
MKVSVIVLNWNGRAHLEHCLPALAGQSYRDFETIVVDNASTRDDSVEFVRARFPWARVVALSENRGFSGGNLAGLEVAVGDYVVLLNNDTRPEPDWLERLVACADVRPGAGIVAAHLLSWDGARTDSAGDGCRVTGRGFARHRGGDAASAPESGPCFGACAGAALYRRELIEDVGFLDAEFFLNFEDTDLSVRARLRGWQAWFCREARVRHRVSASQGAWSPWNAFYGARNHLWVCAKNMPAWLLVKYAPLTLAEVIFLGVRAARHGRLRDYVRGLVEALRGLGPQLAKRRVNLAARRVAVREFDRMLSAPDPAAWWRRRAGRGDAGGGA